MSFWQTTNRFNFSSSPGKVLFAPFFFSAKKLKVLRVVKWPFYGIGVVVCKKKKKKEKDLTVPPYLSSVVPEMCLFNAHPLCPPLQILLQIGAL